jgi:hypothetical protein
VLKIRESRRAIRIGRVDGELEAKAGVSIAAGQLAET